MPNISLNKIATASTNLGAEYVASKAVDGDASTFWHSNGSTWQTEYWQVDLGNVYNLASVTLTHTVFSSVAYNQRMGFTRIATSLSPDGTGLTTVGDVTQAVPPNVVTVTPATPVSGRYVRIFHYQSGGSADTDFLTFSEVNVDGVLDSATPSTLTVNFDGVSVGAQNATNTNHTIVVASGNPPYSAIVYRSTTSGFALGGGDLIVGAVQISGSSITITDSTGIPGQLYFYKTVITDSASQSLSTKQIAGIKALSKLKILFIGDSITEFYSIPSKTAIKLRELKGIREVEFINRGVSGSISGNWIDGSANLNNAKSLAVSTFGSPSSSNPVYASVLLGTNDATGADPVASATFKSNILSLCNNLIAAGYKIILHAPPIRRTPQGAFNTFDTEGNTALVLSYIGALDEICNNSTILKGDRQATNYFAINWNEFIADSVGSSATYVHPNSAGADSYAAFWSKAVLDAIFPSEGTTDVAIRLTAIDAKLEEIKANTSGSDFVIL